MTKSQSLINQFLGFAVDFVAKKKNFVAKFCLKLLFQTENPNLAFVFDGTPVLLASLEAIRWIPLHLPAETNFLSIIGQQSK